MKPTDHMTDEQFQVHVLEIIGRELGVGAMARFIRLKPLWTR